MFFGIELNPTNILVFINSLVIIFFLIRFASLVPVVISIANQFKTDSGSSLRDQLNAM